MKKIVTDLIGKTINGIEFDENFMCLHFNDGSAAVFEAVDYDGALYVESLINQKVKKIEPIIKKFLNLIDEAEYEKLTNSARILKEKLEREQLAKLIEKYGEPK